MKVLVFAHTPPPHHGQSYMVQLMLENVGQPGAASREEIDFYHVNARLSEDLEDVGSWRVGKLFRLLGYIAQAWSLCWKHRPEALYYVPAPAKRAALYRDWLVFLLVAPLFQVRIFHWHAVGLGQWVREGSTLGVRRRLEAWITRRLYSGKELSLILNEWGRSDAEAFSPHRIRVVPNGIPDPCPDFDSTILPLRIQHARERSTLASSRPFELLYLAHATRSKGLFDAVEAVAKANARVVGEPSAKQIRLTVAGAFLNREEEELFRERIQRDDLRLTGDAPNDRAVVYVGYVEAPQKAHLLRTSDALCFASYFPNEGQPVSVIEALAYGLPVLLSNWRGLPEMVPSALLHLTEPRDPDFLAQALVRLLDETRYADYRKCYIERYSLAAHSTAMREAFLSRERSA